MILQNYNLYKKYKTKIIEKNKLISQISYLKNYNKEKLIILLIFYCKMTM